MKSEEIGELKDLLKDSVADVTRLRLKNEDQYQELLKLRERNKELEEAYPTKEEVLDCLMTFGDTDDVEIDLETVSLAIKAIEVLYEDKNYEFHEQTLIDKEEGCCGVVGMIINGKCENCGKLIKED